ncbi:hypothetical protein HMPREF0742_02456 [Rothia aeria F0184]|uniref:Uncharacterized protein n=1 Tax=Rothia aeria F0184 TaxID=888019 RepID=U7UXP5_9MICC|nr:hypothetical protein HMPREF0742_02456 [Rothia aeria F0184]
MADGQYSTRPCTPCIPAVWLRAPPTCGGDGQQHIGRGVR